MEIAQSQYELENMKYLMKSGEKDPKRGIASVFGSIGSRGRSFLFEEKHKVTEGEDEDKDFDCGAAEDSFETAPVAIAETIAEGERSKATPADPPGRRWGLSWKSAIKSAPIQEPAVIEACNLMKTLDECVVGEGGGVMTTMGCSRDSETENGHVERGEAVELSQAKSPPRRWSMWA